MEFVMHRNKTLATTMGHTIEFKKGVATHVPKEAWKEVIAIGAVPADELPEEEIVRTEQVMDIEERKALIFAAMQDIVTRGVREDFTGNGSPHAKVVSEKAGFVIDAKERDAMWIDFRQANEAD